MFPTGSVLRRTGGRDRFSWSSSQSLVIKFPGLCFLLQMAALSVGSRDSLLFQWLRGEDRFCTGEGRAELDVSVRVTVMHVRSVLHPAPRGSFTCVTALFKCPQVVFPSIPNPRHGSHDPT